MGQRGRIHKRYNEYAERQNPSPRRENSVVFSYHPLTTLFNELVIPNSTQEQDRPFQANRYTVERRIDIAHKADTQPLRDEKDTF